MIQTWAHLPADVASGALHLDLLLRSFMPSSVLPALALVLVVLWVLGLGFYWGRKRLAVSGAN